jgi:arabinogalactan oligomer / maltooligosaccharide transport system permease protein
VLSEYEERRRFLQKEAMTPEPSAAPSAPAPPAYRWWFLCGLAAACLLGYWMSGDRIARALTEEKQARAERTAVVTVSALADLLARTGVSAAPAGDVLPRTVGRFAAHHPGVKTIRVLDFAGRRLLDTGTPVEGPRRMEPEGKSLYDLGNQLRAAVEGNRAGAKVRAPELAVERRPDGGLTLIAPVVRAEGVQGIVEMEWAPVEARTAFDRISFLVFSVLSVGWFALFVVPPPGPIPQNRHRFGMAAFATLILCGGLAQYRHEATQQLANERVWTGFAVADRILFDTRETEKLLPAPIAPPLDPNSWDVDLFRRPRGLVKADGTIDDRKLAETARIDAARINRAGIPIALGSLLLLFAFIGFGGAAGSTYRRSDL